MVWKAALTITLAYVGPAIAQEAVPPIWERVADSGSIFRVYYNDVKFDDGAIGGVSLWMRGDNARDKTLNYRSSLWKLYLNCKGSVTLMASTTYKADGSSSSWDGYQNQAIRPDTIYSSLEGQFCSK